MDTLDTTSLQLKNLFQSYSYKNNSSQIQYPSLSQLINPWLDKIQKYTVDQSEYSIRAIVPNVIATNEISESESSDFIMYSRFIIEAPLLDEYGFDEHGKHSKVLGMLAYFDTGNPAMKLYCGYLRQACLNLSVFTNDLEVRGFTDVNFDTIYNYPERAMQQAQTRKTQFIELMNSFYSKEYANDSLEQLYGQLAIKCVSNSGLMTAYTNMVKLLSSSKDANGIKNQYFNKEKRYTMFDIYNAFTNTFVEKNNFINRPDYAIKGIKLFLND